MYNTWTIESGGVPPQCGFRMQGTRGASHKAAQDKRSGVCQTIKWCRASIATHHEAEGERAVMGVTLLWLGVTDL